MSIYKIYIPLTLTKNPDSAGLGWKLGIRIFYEVLYDFIA